MTNYQIKVEKIKTLSPQVNSGICILVVLRGSVRLSINQSDYQIRQVQAAVINHLDLYAVDGGDASNVVLRLHMPQQYLLTSCPEALQSRFSSLPPEDDAVGAELVLQVVETALLEMKKAPGYRIKSQAKVFEILYCLMTKFRKTTMVPNLSDVEENDRLGKILPFLEANFRSRLPLSAVADRYYLSPSHLSRLFRNKLGITFSEYLTHLRLEDAHVKLLETGKSVSQIALESGFANEKMLSKQFQNRYHLTPTEHRRRYARKSAEEKEDQVYALREKSLEELALFLDTYRTRVKTAQNLVVRIDTQRKKERLHLRNVLNIGDISTVLRADVQRQLALAQETLHMHYVRFSILHSPEKMALGDSILPELDYFQAFNLFFKLGLTPMIQLSSEDFQENGQFNPDKADRFLQLLSRLKRLNESSYFSRWMVEVSGMPDSLEAVYAALCQKIHALAPALEVGLGFPLKLRETLWADVCINCAKQAAVSFVTVSADPNLELPQGKAELYEQFHHDYLTLRVHAARTALQAADLADCPLFLIDWNVLTGATIAEAGEFHRTALIAHTLSSLATSVQGFGLALNLFSTCCVVRDLCTYALSLYYYQDMPRALLFVAQYLCGEGQEALYTDDHVICRRDESGQITLALCNPCYMEPFEAMNNLLSEKMLLEIQVTLESLPPGEYRVSRYLMDRDNGSMYRSWMKLDYTLMMYDDMVQILKRTAVPAVTIHSRKLEKELLLETTLSTNAVEVYLISKMN